jgi:hypothetical protein
MVKYYIYHIKGVKIGCTINPKVRVSEQGYTDYEILETHTDIMVASKREIELQKEYAYKVDKVLYWKMIQLQTIEEKRKILKSIEGVGGKIGGNIGGKISGRKNADSGHLKSICKSGGIASHSKRYTCPHCNKEGQYRAMQQFHGDRCKLNISRQM